MRMGERIKDNLIVIRFLVLHLLLVESFSENKFSRSFYLLFLYRRKKNVVFTVTCQKKIGSVGGDFFFF